MAPELFAPSRYDLKNSFPTKEGDIYAFGLVILQVAVVYRRDLAVYFFLTTCRVLTGEQPFGGIKITELAFGISSGFRPVKPEDAETIEISESPWKLVQKCLDDNKTQRPQIKEVVGGVASAADNWHVVTSMRVMLKHEVGPIEEEPELPNNEFLLSFLVVVTWF